MENKAIARSLRLLSQLMELQRENPFKIKSIANAALKVDKLPFGLQTKSLEEIAQIDGLGKSISAKIWELLQTGTLGELGILLKETPNGIVEMLGIKGLGPKKVLIIWKDLGIENIGELLYACNENRLIEAKGFGLKTQDEIKKVIEFQMAGHGKSLYAQAEPMVNKLIEDLSSWLQDMHIAPMISATGEYRRAMEIVEEIELLIGLPKTDVFSQLIPGFQPLKFKEERANTWLASSPFGIQVKLHLCHVEDFFLCLFKLTGSPKHVIQVLERAGPGPFRHEEDIYEKAGLAFIEPELREATGEIELALDNTLPQLITYKDLKGSLHNHSTWSDGVHTLEEMALYCKDHLQLEYLGICDHSKSAFYAKGLNEQRVVAQHQEIDALNARLAPFKIFKGIESDILFDGSLDYDEDILKRFDFVVASVHSVLRMDKEKATSRLITAIENPYTTILGHPTGRLLLSRKGYDIDFEKVIDACAANQVVIEINSNPLRLDLDWRWHRYALQRGVLLSINPDAHRVEGLLDMNYGIKIARKGGLEKNQCLNAFSLKEITDYFNNKK